MPRALSLYLPMWSVDLVRRRDRRRLSAGRPPEPARPRHADRRPILLVETTGQRRLVARCCERALRAGVRRGMDLAHARAVLPPAPRDGIDNARALPWRPQRDAAALAALAEWAVRFSPLVMADPPDGLLMDIGGCARLYGSQRTLVDRVADAAAGLGFRVRAAAAPTFGCAWAVARFGGHDRAVVADGAQHAALAPLPIESLRLPPTAAAALREVGVELAGELMQLPRASLPSRFGPELLLRLDQAIGQALEVIDPVRPREPARVERILDGPTPSLEAVLLVTRQLVAELCAQLARRESGARRLELDLLRTDVGTLTLAVTLSRPSRSPSHLWSLLQPHVERANLGFGVERFTLTAAMVGRVRHEQTACWAGASGDPGAGAALELGELIDTLTNRYGPERVVRMLPVATHLPERATRAWPVTETPAPRPGSLHALLKEADRPSTLLAPPEEVRALALAPDGVPTWLRWRGRDHEIAAGTGPERIGPEWWRCAIPGAPAPHTRDYFRVQDREGLWLWVYHEPATSRWFVHGLWA